MELSEAPVMEEVKRGFKKTEVGVIPNDWEAVPLESCLELLTDFESNGSFADVAANVVVHDHEEYAWYVRATDLENDSPLSTVRYVDRRSFEFLKKTRLYGGEVLITKRGEIGKVYLFKARTSFATVAPNLYLLKLNGKVVPQYVYNYFKYGRGNVTLKTINASTTLGALYKNDVKSLLLPLPSNTEQRAIATALSDVDALLGSLDALIAKKKAIKHGAMQQLLTGKQRLPGFKGEWEVKRLGEVFRISAGQSKSRFIKDGGRYLIVDMGSVSTEGRLICSKETDYHGDFLKRGDLIMPKDDIGGGKIIGKAAFIDRDKYYVLGDHVYLLEAEQGDPLFLSFMINAWTTNSALRKKVGGSAQLSLGRKSVAEQEIPFPDMQEQTAIATVLSDMDAEVEALAARRAKTALLKQGMMQELLTGRTRLV
jgi:type I restriction enzyme S subunit